MADISADSILPSGGDGVTLSGSQPLVFGNNSGSANGIGFAVTPSVSISSSLTTVLLLTGRRVINYLFLQNLDPAAGNLRVQILIDGAVVLDQTEVSSARSSVLILGSSLAQTMLKANSSIELRAQKSGSTAVQASYCSLVVL